MKPFIVNKDCHAGRRSSADKAILSFYLASCNHGYLTLFSFIIIQLLTPVIHHYKIFPCVSDVHSMVQLSSPKTRDPHRLCGPGLQIRSKPRQTTGGWFFYSLFPTPNYYDRDKVTGFERFRHIFTGPHSPR